MMGRKRKHRKDLPPRVYFQHGAYYFVTKENEWVWLSRDEGKARRRHADIVTAPIAGRMSAIMDRYIKEEAPKKSPRTLDNNKREIEPLKTVFGHMEPHEIDATGIYQYMDARKPVAGNREVALLSSVFKFAIRKGLASENPCKFVSRNTETPRNRHIEDWEYEAVYKIAPPVIQCAMDLARQIALRLGDLLKLNERDMREDGILVVTGKTGKKLLFEWTDELRETVGRCRDLRKDQKIRSMYLLSNREGQKYTVSGFETNWQKTMRKALKAGLVERFRFNDIRAMAADKSANPTELLGHNDPKVTNRIYRRAPRRVRPNTKILDT